MPFHIPCRHLPFILLCLAVLIQAPAAEVVDDSRIRESWIAIDQAVGERDLAEGQRFDVAVDYELKPGPAATLELLGLGPWIDNPDGVYAKKRMHIDLPGLSARAEVQPGRGTRIFSFTMPALPAHAAVMWLAQFKDGGKAWPWQVRSGNGPLRSTTQAFAIVSDRPGKLFTYAQPVSLTLVAGAKAVAGEDRVAAWSVIDCDGRPVADGSLRFRSEGPGQRIPLPLPIERRGVFGLRVDIPGWGVAETSFARIPDVLAATAGKPTRFGMHHVVRPGLPADLAEGLDMARLMGLTWCRSFVSLKVLHPAPGEWRLDGWDRALALAKEKGMAAALCLGDPPPWMLRGPASASYRSFDFDRDAWRSTITTLSRRWQGRVASYEWLNEIVPGDGERPVQDYVDFCRIGTEAAKAADPAVLIQLAGGLWPRNFRRALLGAGIARSIDVLPVHYGSGAGVDEARGDLDAVGAKSVAVWDNETGRGASTWGMPQAEAIRLDIQRNWVMERWTSELAAGAERLVYFGGVGDAAGNWDYAYEDHSPRPVAATLAVLVAKLHAAEPQGSFAIGASGPFHLFVRSGRPVLVVPKGGAGETVELRVGAPSVTLTDDQGEERAIAAHDGLVTVPLGARPGYIEGGDLDVLRAYTVPTLRTSELSMLAGRSGSVVVDVRNRGGRPLAGTLTLELPPGLGVAEALPFTLAPGASSQLRIELAIAAAAAPGEHGLRLLTRFADASLPEVAVTVALVVLSPAQLGNLLTNGGFEDGGKAWEGMGKGSSIADADGFGDGLGGKILRFSNPNGSWARVSQPIPVLGGRRYLYSAWIRNHGMEAASNIDQTFADGSGKTLYAPQVFTAGSNNADWQLVSCVYAAPTEARTAAFSPVANGDGFASYDNVRVTLYEGTAFAAEATRAATRPVIDGKLDEWAAGCPIPLLGPGQLSLHDPAYAWTAANCRGVARLEWDDEGLYLAAVVEDDRHVAVTTGDQTTEGDSLVLALHPGNRSPGSDARAFAYLLSSAAPGGGSGKTTLFRPADRSGGLASGQLAKDSSIYEIAIVTTGTRTVYELRMPWSELGCAGHLGTRLGCSLQLNDNDGTGRAASIGWGEGLLPAWDPTGFGIVTLVQ